MSLERETGRTDGTAGGRLPFGYTAMANNPADGKNEKMLITSKKDIGTRQLGTGDHAMGGM